MIRFVSYISQSWILFTTTDIVLLLYLVTDMDAYQLINFLLRYTCICLYFLLGIWSECAVILSYPSLFFSIEFVVASYKSCKETDSLAFYNTIVKSLFDIRELVDKTHTKPAAKLWCVAEGLVHGVCNEVCLVYIHEICDTSGMCWL